MKFLVSAKGNDITTWRAAIDFAASFRQSVLDQAAFGRNGSTESVYSGSVAMLEEAAETHRSLMSQMNRVLEEGRASLTSSRLKELTGEYYGLLYRHAAVFHSAPTFYTMSMHFVKMLSTAVMALSKEQLGLFARHLPKMSLVALGPAGRCEYSPFCPLQLVLVHEAADASQLQTIGLFSQTFHDEMDAAGLAVDPVISPRNPEWRGSVPEWRQRFDDGLHHPTTDGMINMLRLTDQFLLTGGEELAQELRESTIDSLRKSRPVQANLIERMESLSNGLGMMGGLKLERSGSERGLFRLVDHGLLPLSSALSALALIKESRGVSSCDRVRDLLGRRELDVDLAEKILETWHSLHELRLHSEQSCNLFERAESSLFLDPAQLTAEQRQTLKTALSTIAAIQRHVAVLFSGMGE